MAIMIDETKVRYFVMGANDDGPPTTIDVCASAAEAGRIWGEYRQLGLWERLWIVVKN